MKALSLSLLIFAMVVVLSSAFPGKEKDKSSKLVVSENPDGDGTSLQRRKPPMKSPGPKLTDERGPDSSSEMSKTESLNNGKKGGKKHLTNDSSKEKNDSVRLDSLNDNGKRKKHVANRGKNNGDSKEETQEERSILF